MVNTETSSSSSATASCPSSTLVVEALSLVLKVDHLEEVATILLVGKPTSPLALMKMVRYEEQPSPLNEVSPK